MKNLLVLQSGGPTAVINSSLAGVIKYGFDHPETFGKVYGSIGGIEGVENERIVDLEFFNNEKTLALLKQTPSSHLGSCRKKLPAVGEDDAYYERLFSVFEKYNIGYLCCIGGNDSMDTTNKLSIYAKENSKELNVVGVPKTIDNDLVITDHTPGFGSAAKFVANCMRQLACDTSVYEMHSVLILEAMGRNAGWLTAAASLANDDSFSGADIICLPERPFDPDKFLARLESVSHEKKCIMIALSEGIRDKDGNYIKQDTSSSRTKTDKFGHAALGGAGKAVETLISSSLGLKTRTLELSTLQRCYSAGASLCDVNEAFEAGYKGAEFAANGQTGIMASFTRASEAPYSIIVEPIPVSLVANKEKPVPDNMISPDGFSLTEEFAKYALPLISGEPELIYENGRIQFAPPVR